MAPTVRKIQVLKPACLKGGYYFQSCRAFRSAAGIRYDYNLYNKYGRKLKLQQRGWRKVLSFNFAVRRAAEKRIDVHRLFAMNSRRCNTRWIRWNSRAHVHHHPRPRRRPWSDCRAQNMIVLLEADHAEWHRGHPDVPNCL